MSLPPPADLESSAPQGAVPTTLTDPTPREGRISAVDVLRGVALLGILLVNITSFGLPCEGKHTLLVDTSRNVATVVWFTVSVLFEGKMRALFSMLFGAGVVLLTERFERRGEVAHAADIYYRRTLWLLAIGVLHGLFLWEGDILSVYGLAGLFLYPFRKLRGRTLLVVGALVLLLTVPAAVIEAWRLEELRDAAAKAEADEAAGHALSRDERDELNAWQDALDDARPGAETIAESLAAHRGGYWTLFAWRNSNIEEFTSGDLFDAIGMMFFGMGLLKLGVITAARTNRFYAALALAGLAIGLPLHAWATWWFYAHDFDPIAYAWSKTVYDPGRLAIALAYAALVMLVVRAGILRWLLACLAAVGQTALTNYLATTVICTTLFNGYGFGLFGELARYQLYYVVLGVWAAQLAISPTWLRYFLYGPAEWAWRSLTYWQRQPLRRELPRPPLPSGEGRGEGH